MNKSVFTGIAIVLMAFFVVSCGSSGATQNIEEPTFDLSEADQGSYLPLISGLKTTISFENDKGEEVEEYTLPEQMITIKDISITVEDGEVVKISGTIIRSNVPVEIIETLKFKREGNMISLVEYSASAQCAENIYGVMCNNANHRVYEPPVLLLNDEYNISIDDKYIPESVNVTFDGSPDYFTDPEGGDDKEVYGLNGVSVELTVGRMEQGTLQNGDAVDVYHISLPVEAAKAWYSVWGFVGLANDIGLAKGIGIVSLGGLIPGQSVTVEGNVVKTIVRTNIN